jgi:sigma-B regulation protein RsbU (phosphoserine phosphatase)
VKCRRNEGGILRRNALILFAIAVCFVTQGHAQTPHHHPPALVDHFLGGDHSRPAPARVNAPETPAITLDASTLGSPVVLDKGWRVGITANPAAASPDFNDSTWAVRDAQESFADVPDEDHPTDSDDDPGDKGDKPSRTRPSGPTGRPFVWFRLHIKLPPNHGPVALLVELPVSENTSMSITSSGPGIDVFANGKQVHPDGPHSDNPQHYQQISRLYHLNVPAGQTDLVLVLRTIYIGLGYAGYTSFFANRTLHLGHPDDLERRLELWTTHGLFQRLPRVVNAVLLLVLAIFLLALYFTQKGHVEYLWLALHELVQAPLGFVELAGASARLDTLWYAAIVLQLAVLSAYLYFEFLIAFLSLRPEKWQTRGSIKWLVKWYIRLLRYTSPVLLGVGPVLLMVGHSDIVGVVLFLIFAISAFWLLGWVMFVFLTLIIATVRRNFEAGLLLIPLILSIVGIAEPIYTAVISSMGSKGYQSPLTFYAGPIPIHSASFADLTSILAIVIIIFIRFLRVQRDQERASSELAAARSVQELMIPQEKIQTPGFEVDSVYNPANEVGGDFFHVQPTEDGGLLVIIGDVAGKGLKAAMNVSMIMGGVRRTPERSPAKILQSLNRVLYGSESFTTCQVAWLAPSGELVIANAGHLPPYLNSQEVAVPGGLPLGVLPEVVYDEMHLYLHPGDRILLMSDGVVEARHHSGELFGFDRVQNLTNQSAFYIADAAKDFGQEDDITVLTVRRLAQALAA